MRRTRLERSFILDLQAQVSWLRQHRDAEYVERLRDGIFNARRLLAAKPGVGSPQLADGSITIRKLLLRDLPFVIWYFHDELAPRADVWLFRLFHARQDRPSPVVRRRQSRRRRRRVPPGL